MKTLIKTVLDEYGWRYLEGEDSFKLDVDGENTSWISFLKLEDDEVFSYYSVLPAKAEEDLINSISELLLKINYIIKIGSFEINLSDGAGRGQIMFKTYGLLPASLVKSNTSEASDLIRRTLAYNMLTMNFYSKSLLKAIYSGQIDLNEILNTSERGEQV